MLKRRPVDWAGCVAQSRIDFEKYYNHKVATKWERREHNTRSHFSKWRKISAVSKAGGGGGGGSCGRVRVGSIGDLVWVRIFFSKPLVIIFFP